MLAISDNETALNYFNNGECIDRTISGFGESVIFYGSEEFVLYLSDNKSERILKSSQMKFFAENKEKNILLNYSYESLTVIVNYLLKNGLIYKNLIVTSTEPILLKRVVTENLMCLLPFTRGGEGQPVFVGNNLWCAMENPVALNNYHEKALQFMQSPFINLNQGIEFNSFNIAFGFKNCATLENSFLNYIKSQGLPNTQSCKIYCDWGMHDELSDNLHLSEKMALDIVDHIENLKKENIVDFNYYLMDAFWFEEYSDYINYSKEKFPNSIDYVLQRLKKAGVKYGLWFDLNFIHGKIANNTECLRDAPDNSLCISCDEIISRLENALSFHIKNHGVKMFKFDFAFFECINLNHHKLHSLIENESKEVAVNKFIAMLNRLRNLEPELKILAYNGFTTRLDFIGSIQPHNGYAISPYWSKYIEYLYCGDPRPSEIATEKLSDSIIYYTDSMIRMFSDSLMPLRNIDDHGTMIGHTGTIYWLDKECLYKSLIMNIMRGNRKYHIYGNFNMLDGSDKEFLKFADNIYNDIIDCNMDVCPILGNPILREVYGYSAASSQSGYIVIVNPLAVSQTVNVSPNEWATGDVINVSKIFVNKSCDSQTKQVNQFCSVNLEPGDVILLKWEKAHTLVATKKVCATIDANSHLEMKFNVDVEKVCFTFFDSGRVIRSPHGIPYGIRIQIGAADVKLKINQFIWSGMSWQHISLDENKQICLVNESDKPVSFYWEERFK